MYRGGSFYNIPSLHQVSMRGRAYTKYRDIDLGFRLAADPEN